MENRRVGLLLLGCVVFQLALVTLGECQAWVSPKKTGFISISYLNDFSNTDYFGRGEQFILVPANPAIPNGFKLEKFGELPTHGVHRNGRYAVPRNLATNANI